MEIRSLTQVKRMLANKHSYKILDHRVQEFIGQVRVANKIQSNGCYLVVKNKPNHKVSKSNGNLGSWLEFGKAKDWEFCGDVCSLYHGVHIPENMVFKIQFMESEDNR